MLFWILQNTILAGLLAAAVALVCRWKRVGPALRHALWVLVLLRLVWPPGLVPWPWQSPALPSASAPAAAETREVATGPTQAPAVEGVPENVEIVRLDKTDEPTVAAPALEAAAPVVASEPIRWWVLAWWAGASIWTAGAVVVA